VIHRTAPLAIFLVVKVESHAVGLLKLRQCHAVRKDCAVFEKADVLSAELYCPGS
jgi:hypothetical protein